MIVPSDHEKRPPNPADEEILLPAKLDHGDQRRRRFRRLFIAQLGILCLVVLFYKAFKFTRYANDGSMSWRVGDHGHHGHHKNKKSRDGRIEKLFLCARSLLHI
jgi:hypothetical protein